MVLSTDKVKLPHEVATFITKKAKDTSTIAALSPAEPQMFINKDNMVFTGAAEAEVVAEGAKKGSYEQTVTNVVGKMFKVQTTTRVTDELRFADADSRLEILSKIQADQAAALGRALDYVVYHAVSPKGATALTGFEKLSANAQQVTASSDRLADIDKLVEAVNEDYDVTGIAMSKKMANELRAIRTKGTQQRLFPEIPLNVSNLGQFDGIPAAASSTVNGSLIKTTPTNVLAFLGDFGLIRWGMVRDIWSEIIEYGDPDNSGVDLKNANQVAYRTEAIYSYAVLDPNGIAVLKSATTTSSGSGSGSNS